MAEPSYYAEWYAEAKALQATLQAVVATGQPTAQQVEAAKEVLFIGDLTAMDIWRDSARQPDSAGWDTLREIVAMERSVFALLGEDRKAAPWTLQEFALMILADAEEALPLGVLRARRLHGGPAAWPDYILSRVVMAWAHIARPKEGRAGAAKVREIRRHLLAGQQKWERAHLERRSRWDRLAAAGQLLAFYHLSEATQAVADAVLGGQADAARIWRHFDHAERWAPPHAIACVTWLEIASAHLLREPHTAATASA